MDDSKKQLLKDIFWEMNSISSRTESKSETVITETDDGNGNIVQTETTVTRTYLYISVSHKTVDEMAVQYGFIQPCFLLVLPSAKFRGIAETVSAFSRPMAAA